MSKPKNPQNREPHENAPDLRTDWDLLAIPRNRRLRNGKKRVKIELPEELWQRNLTPEAIALYTKLTVGTDDFAIRMIIRPDADDHQLTPLGVLAFEELETCGFVSLLRNEDGSHARAFGVAEYVKDMTAEDFKDQLTIQQLMGILRLHTVDKEIPAPDTSKPLFCRKNPNLDFEWVADLFAQPSANQEN